MGTIRRHFLDVFQSFCRRGAHLHGRPNRHQFHRPDGRKNLGFVHAVGCGFAGAWAVSVPGGFCRGRGYRTYLRVWVSLSKRRHQRGAKGIVWGVYGRAFRGERRGFGGGDFFLYHGDAV